MDYKKLIYPLMASLTLGLAPMFPEPHIWEKLKWIAGGEKTLALIDWFDVLMHGAPWVWLIYTVATLKKSSKQD